MIWIDAAVNTTAVLTLKSSKKYLNIFGGHMNYQEKYKQTIELQNLKSNTQLQYLAMATTNQNSLYIADWNNSLIISINKIKNGNTVTFSQNKDVVDFGLNFTDPPNTAGLCCNPDTSINSIIYASYYPDLISKDSGQIAYFDSNTNQPHLYPEKYLSNAVWLSQNGKIIYWAETVPSVNDVFGNTLIRCANSKYDPNTVINTIDTGSDRLVQYHFPRPSNASWSAFLGTQSYIADAGSVHLLDVDSPIFKEKYDYNSSPVTMLEWFLESNDHRKLYLILGQSVPASPLDLAVFDIGSKTFSYSSLVFKDEHGMNLGCSCCCVDAATGNLRLVGYRADNPKSVVVFSIDLSDNNRVVDTYIPPVFNIRDIITDKDGFTYLMGANSTGENNTNNNVLYIYK